MLTKRLLEASERNKEICILNYVRICAVNMICGMFVFVVSLKIIINRRTLTRLATVYYLRKKTHHNYTRSAFT